MEQLIAGMQKIIAELIKWQTANPNVPEAVNQAIQNYRNEMIKKIETMAKTPFETGDIVELVSSSYEDSEHFSGDLGKVVDVKSSVLPCGHVEHDIQVVWDNGTDECWINAADFIRY
ncbi:hypothetical protein [Paenibacillus larvae]|uniref:Uncharacterized protein n=1 Tax=Paenibacillus larvae subsp. larvae TaxID=147375 RepID=A0A2L1U7D5_9BACL|nr:hypothetical protein [Paenibacillus larvae]AVF28854.1 hypothetical protein ERICIII_04851 [Paenibacillus larvae subsp. larvae]MCY9500313.1 hypothetical protein [Paenibacillus larvae]MDR5608750.1 hypothetical protein [Paenibacillus larvae]